MIVELTRKNKEKGLVENSVNKKEYKFERVGKKYELNARTMKRNNKLGSLNSLIKSKYVSIDCKLRIYKTVIRSTVANACETWVLNNADEQALEKWERKF